MSKNIVNKLVKIAAELDQNHMFVEADYLTNLMCRLAGLEDEKLEPGLQMIKDYIMINILPNLSYKEFSTKSIENIIMIIITAIQNELITIQDIINKEELQLLISAKTEQETDEILQKILSARAKEIYFSMLSEITPNAVSMGYKDPLDLLTQMGYENSVDNDDATSFENWQRAQQ